MPYIEQERRPVFDREVEWLGMSAASVGELTYVLYRLVHVYLFSGDKEPDYARHAEVVAALDNAKSEFYARTVTPYEKRKREENGDVFEDRREDSPFDALIGVLADALLAGGEVAISLPPEDSDG